MRKHWRLIGLGSALFLSEVASYWKLKGFMAWGYEELLAYIVALSFNALLFGGLIALAHDMDDGMRQRIRLAGTVLFLTQGLANVLLTYEHALVALPLDIPTRFFGLDPESALKLSAVVEGGVLSIVSIVFWQVLASLLHQQRQESVARDRTIKQALAVLEHDLDGHHPGPEGAVTHVSPTL